MIRPVLMLKFRHRIFELRKVISNRAECLKLVSPNHQIDIDGLVESGPNYHLYEGHFTSPMVTHAAHLLPPEAQVAKFQLLLPKQWPHQKLRPLVIHLAGTGDHVRDCSPIDLSLIR